MLNERVMSSSNPLNIMPEDFYANKLRKDFIEVLTNVEFDPVLVSTVEEVMNKADGYSVNQMYEMLEDSLQPLATALLSRNYQKTNEFIRADEEEKVIVRKLIADIQDLLMIIKCTKEPEKEEKQLSRERLNYDKDKKENVIVESDEQTTQRQRIPNIV